MATKGEQWEQDTFYSFSSPSTDCLSLLPRLPCLFHNFSGFQQSTFRKGKCLSPSCHYISHNVGFPGSLAGKESACSVWGLSSIPGLGRSPGEGISYPLQSSGLENSMDRGAWKAIVHGVTVRHLWATLTFKPQSISSLNCWCLTKILVSWFFEILSTIVIVPHHVTRWVWRATLCIWTILFFLSWATWLAES